MARLSPATRPERATFEGHLFAQGTDPNDLNRE
jgi:hypothetical protein